MRIWGKLLGSLIGVSAGPFGIIMGFLVGHLIDQLVIKSKSDANIFLKKNPRFKYTAELKAIIDMAIYISGPNSIRRENNKSKLLAFLNNHFLLPRSIKEMENQIIFWDTVNIENACKIIYRFSNGREESFNHHLFLFLNSLSSDKTINENEKMKRIKIISELLDYKSPSPFITSLDPESCTVLGVSRTADEQEIKRAFRKLASKYHPDKKGQHSKDNNQFIIIRNAYEQLMQQIRHR